MITADEALKIARLNELAKVVRSIEKAVGYGDTWIETDRLSCETIQSLRDAGYKVRNSILGARISWKEQKNENCRGKL